ncbi:hypothetical protein [Shigella sonnei]
MNGDNPSPNRPLVMH